MKSLNYRDFEYLLTVGRLGNITRAASVCNITQPALSNKIKRIENRLGFVIFERRKGVVAPSHAGDVLLEKVEHIVQHMKEFQDLVLKFRQPSARPMRIAICPSIAPYAIPQLCLEIHAAHPDINLQFQELPADKAREKLLEKRLEFALMPGQNADSAFVCRHIAIEDYVLLASAHHPVANRKFLRLGDIPVEDLIPEPNIQLDIDALKNSVRAKEIGVEIPSKLLNLSIVTLVEYIVRRAGCAVVPKYTAKYIVEGRRDIVSVQVRSDQLKREINFFYQEPAINQDVAQSVELVARRLFSDD